MGIPVSILDEPLARVSSDQFASFVHLLWRQLDDELLGFGHQPVRFGFFFLMGRSVVQSATLNSALHRAARTYALIQDGRPPFAIDCVDGTVRIVFDDSQLDDPDHFAAEMLIVAWHRFSSWLIKRRISFLEVSFNYSAPRHRKEYDLMFSAPFRFDAGQTAFTFDALYLSAPVLQTSGSLRPFIQNYYGGGSMATS